MENLGLQYIPSFENGHLLTKSGFSKVPEKAKIDYFDANLLNRKMVVAKMLTKSGLLTILRLTKSGFHCTTYVPMCAKRKRHSII